MHVVIFVIKAYRMRMVTYAYLSPTRSCSGAMARRASWRASRTAATQSNPNVITLASTAALSLALARARALALTLTLTRALALTLTRTAAFLRCPPRRELCS